MSNQRQTKRDGSRSKALESPERSRRVRHDSSDSEPNDGTKRSRSPVRSRQRNDSAGFKKRHDSSDNDKKNDEKKRSSRKRNDSSDNNAFR